MTICRIALLVAALSLAGCNQSADFTPKVTDEAVQVPVGKYFLIRSSRHRAAIMLTKPISKGDGGFEYTWHYWDVDNKISMNGSGEVFEKYTKTQVAPNLWKVREDIGSPSDMKCGSIAVEWSSGNRIGFFSPTGPVEIAVTSEDRVDRISFDDPNLVWYMPDISNNPYSPVKTTAPSSPTVAMVKDSDEQERIARLYVVESTAIAVAEYEPSKNGKVEAVITSVLKVDPNVEWDYKVGDKPSSWAYVPKAGVRNGDGIVVFFEGTPAKEEMKMAYYGDRIPSLGGMSVNSLLKVVRAECKRREQSSPADAGQ